MNIILQLVLFLFSVILGGLLVEFLKKTASIKMLLSFSGGFLLTIIFTHILPESYDQIEYTGIFILVGFFLQLVLEYFSQGAEHGHTHVHKNVVSHFPIAIFLSLSLHAFIEAIPLNHGLHHGHAHGMNDLYWGVFIHKIPVAIALKTILDASGVSKRNSWIYLIIFGLTAPLGLIFGEVVMANFEVSLSWLLAIAIGMFFHVSTTIIFESSEGHKINFFKLMAILAGFGVGIAIG
ncbi:MAG: ZIP family metal transporter [Crocinitomix sp.]|nr:ZIP family metal transporter [Crocinitomix sp.]